MKGLRNRVQAGFLLLALMGSLPAAAGYLVKGNNYTERFGGTVMEGKGKFDINAWGYTPAFAKRFAMPNRWLEPELSGVEGIAFRTEVYAYEPWRPAECLFDLYLNQEAEIPWLVGINESGRRYIYPHSPEPIAQLKLLREADRQWARRAVGIAETDSAGRHQLNWVAGDRVVPLRVRNYQRSIGKGLDRLLLVFDCQQMPGSAGELVLGSYRIGLTDSYLERVRFYHQARRDEPFYLTEDRVIDIPPTVYQWVYTRDFAERFGLPEQWIDEDLQGVEAVVYYWKKDGGVTFLRKPGHLVAGGPYIDFIFSNEQVAKAFPEPRSAGGPSRHLGSFRYLFEADKAVRVNRDWFAGGTNISYQAVRLKGDVPVHGGGVPVFWFDREILNDFVLMHGSTHMTFKAEDYQMLLFTVGRGDLVARDGRPYSIDHRFYIPGQFLDRTRSYLDLREVPDIPRVYGASLESLTKQ
ncbi:hypothetical protein [Aestuariirhabdus litorea]|uniref:DUF1329 domain-containing protein n=1 Tax=Aestuariirhabdus litorea TaxID=2528527 RepID=A0A3P3VQA6_9GAMM|nr:hypothetical protein [Aestuariirhabdus litorea]RRJ84507.1 hypothetical protein D0544_05215 [Aestuariirhabdus litorea]RWW97732.1 hypothetical protein DZC74_05210 [Endozoicomonadaceae bacterium GTF-13]